MGRGVHLIDVQDREAGCRAGSVVDRKAPRVQCVAMVFHDVHRNACACVHDSIVELPAHPASEPLLHCTQGARSPSRPEP